jgi:hypothetical protein
MADLVDADGRVMGSEEVGALGDKKTQRRLTSCFLLYFLIAVSSVLPGPAAAQVSAPGKAFESVRASYSALVPSGAPFWIAKELGLFEKEGLRVDRIQREFPAHSGGAESRVAPSATLVAHP